MKELNKKEMLDIKGGGVSIGVIAIITAAVAFIIGVIDGYTNPSKCKA